MKLVYSCLIAFALVYAAGAPAQEEEELLTEEEQAERDLAKRKAAPPVLKCTPTKLAAEVKKGLTEDISFKIQNAGGQVLKWQVSATPDWLRVHTRSGDVEFEGDRAIFATIESAEMNEGGSRGVIVLEAPEQGTGPAIISVEVNVLPPPEGLISGPQAVAPEGYFTASISRLFLSEGRPEVGGGKVGKDHMNATRFQVGVGKEFGEWRGSLEGRFSTVDSDWDQGGVLPADMQVDRVAFGWGIRATRQLSRRFQFGASLGYERVRFEIDESPFGAGTTTKSFTGVGGYGEVGAVYMAHRHFSLMLNAGYHLWSYDKGQLPDGTPVSGIDETFILVTVGATAHF